MDQSISWSDLRPLDGSQHTAFEELCAQLASAEAFPGGIFVRKGSPDAGVDWSVRRRTYAWQAKFFTSRPGGGPVEAVVFLGISGAARADLNTLGVPGTSRTFAHWLRKLD
jgi:hypothetical protein